MSCPSDHMSELLFRTRPASASGAISGLSGYLRWTSSTTLVTSVKDECSKPPSLQNLYPPGADLLVVKPMMSWFRLPWTTPFLWILAKVFATFEIIFWAKPSGHCFLNPCVTSCREALPSFESTMPEKTSSSTWSYKDTIPLSFAKVWSTDKCNS